MTFPAVHFDLFSSPHPRPPPCSQRSFLIPLVEREINGLFSCFTPLSPIRPSILDSGFEFHQTFPFFLSSFLPIYPRGEDVQTFLIRAILILSRLLLFKLFTYCFLKVPPQISRLVFLFCGPKNYQAFFFFYPKQVVSDFSLLPTEFLFL